MTTRTVGITLLVLALLGTAGVAWRERRQLATTTTAANAARSELESRIRGVLTARDSAVASRSAAETKLAKLKPTAAELKSRQGTPGEAQRIPNIAERLRTQPDFQVLWLDVERRRIELRYRPLFQRLGLTPEQIATCVANQVRKSEMTIDLNAIATEELRRSGKKSETLAKAIEQIEPEYAAAQRALLGEAGFRQLEEFDRTAAIRDWVSGWAGGATVYLGEPLTREQGEQLIEVIANASSEFQKGSVAQGKIDWQSVDAAAKRILSPKQYAFFTSTEPPLPTGGRLQNQLYVAVDTANALDKKSP